MERRVFAILAVQYPLKGDRTTEAASRPAEQTDICHDKS
jgi:hypothetical protein